MVRTDSKEQKLDAFVVPKSLQFTAASAATTSSSSLSVSRKTSVDHLQGREGGERQTIRQDGECVEEEGGREVGMEGVETGEGCRVEEAGMTGCQGLTQEDRDTPCCSGSSSVEGMDRGGKNTAMDSASSSSASSSTTGG